MRHIFVSLKQEIQYWFCYKTIYTDLKLKEFCTKYSDLLDNSLNRINIQVLAEIIYKELQELQIKNDKGLKVVSLAEIKTNQANPRFIKDDKFEKLVASIKEFPEMLKLRPIIVDESMVVLGGNMRLKACLSAGLERVPIIEALGLTEEQKKEFTIKDNVNYGDWDWDKLTSEWNGVDLEKYGLDQWLGGENVSNDNDYFGLDAESKLDKFLDAKIKNLTIPFESQEFDDVIIRLERYLQKYGLEGYKEMIYKLLENENL